MCGINGLINFNLPKPSSAIGKMNQAILHRGPDANGVYVHEKTALGHVRLSIIDLSSQANQPMENERYVMVFNGEVYNYEALKIQYSLNVHTQSDTEVILAGFTKIGPAFFKELNGMFVIALLDKQTEEVYLVRDRIGIKPLYLYNKNNQFAFSSELKGLYAIPEIKSQLTIRTEAISDFFHLGYIPAPLTIYQEIAKFPAGYYAKIKGNKIEYHAYWKLEDHIQKTTLNNPQQAKKELKALLQDAVKIRLKSDVPFGTFLSGGIDSSLVTAIAQEQHTQSLNTFSIGFEEQSHNEAHYAAQVAKHIGTKHHEFMVSHLEAQELIPNLMLDYDEPFGDSSAIPTMLVSRLARKEVKMTLSGDGGDELFMGYGFYTWAKRLHHPLIQLNKKLIPYVLAKGNSRMQRAAWLFDYPNKGLKSHIFSQEQYYFSQQELALLLKKNTQISPFLNQDIVANRTLNPMEQQSFFDLKYYLKDELLTKVDIATMKYGLEARVPLLDYRLIQWGLNLDTSLKFKKGIQKYLLKEVLYDYVPAPLFNRPKQGFSIPLGKWLQHELRFLIDDYLSDTQLNQSNFLNPSYAKSIVREFLNGKSYLYTKVWAMIVFQMWYKKVHQAN